MAYPRSLQLIRELVQNNRQVQKLLDQILDTAVNPKVLENREDWSEVKKTVELFAYTGIVLEPHRRRRAEDAWKAPDSTAAGAE
ncbi:MAG: hypothetical protein ACK493_17095 [Planctomycetota bacterium]|jgi:hypothetical protein